MVSRTQPYTQPLLLLPQALLLALPVRDGRPDGYLARQQEGELKYMLAFASPARALEWVLLLQVRGRGCCWQLVAREDAVCKPACRVPNVPVTPVIVISRLQLVARLLPGRHVG
jgi:hypothetical protein